MTDYTQTPTAESAATSVAERPESSAPAETREPQLFELPSVDIREREGGGLEILANLPGVASDGVDIDLDRGVLTIRATQERDESEHGEDGRILRREFARRDYFRQFRVREEIDADKIVAELKNGVLRVELPLAEKAKPRKIAVSTI